MGVAVTVALRALDPATHGVVTGLCVATSMQRWDRADHPGGLSKGSVTGISSGTARREVMARDLASRWVPCGTLEPWSYSKSELGPGAQRNNTNCERYRQR